MPPVPLYEWTSCPFWVLQIWTHLSKLPLARNFPSGENATLYTGSLCLVRVCTQVPLSTSHSLTVESKLAEARTRFMLGLLVPGPVGLHLMALTSLVWPWNDLIGFSFPSWQTWICLSVEQDAKLSSDFQSTSSAGAEWKENCCLLVPVAASQMMVVLSTPALRM